MLPELGHIFLIISFLLFALQLAISLEFQTLNLKYSFFDVVRKLSFFSYILIVSSFAILIINYIYSDFSVLNVFNNTHTNKPLIYKITGTWGNHEGSLLLWLLVLTLFIFLFIFFSKKQPVKYRFLSIFFQQIIISGFFLFLLLTSNPFNFLFPILCLILII